MRDQISSSQNYTMYNVDIALCTKPHTVYSSHNLKVKHISIKTSALCFHSLFSRSGAVCTYSSFKFKFEIQILGVALLQVPGPTFQIQILGVALLLLHFTVAHLSYICGTFELHNASLLSSLTLRIGSSVDIFLLPVQAPVEEENRENDNDVDPGHPDTHPALLL